MPGRAPKGTAQARQVVQVPPFLSKQERLPLLGALPARPGLGAANLSHCFMAGESSSHTNMWQVLHHSL